MAYEYEYEGKNMMAGVYSSLATNESVKELEEVYAKAKAFDEILEVDNQATDEDRLTGEYESNIETIIGDYMEDK